MWNRILSIVVIGVFIISMIGIGSAITDDDAEFYQWTDYKWKRMAYAMTGIVTAELNEDTSKFHASGYGLMITCDKALDEIENYNVSEDMLPIKNTFRVVLKDVRSIGYWAHQSAYGCDKWVYINRDFFDKYVDSGEKAQTSIMAYIEAVENYEALHGPLPTPQPTPTPKKGIPGFEAIFVIAGLLAVAYLVLRRRTRR
jgi:PGF-CTERM protein